MAEITLTDSNFDTEVMQAVVPVLVDFWAEWCGPCKMQNPILEEVEKEIGEKAKVGKLNVDENPGTASKYGVMSIPTLMLFNHGNMVKQWIGVQSKDALLSEINAILK